MKRVTFRVTKQGQEETVAEDYADTMQAEDLQYLIGLGEEFYRGQGYTVDVLVTTVANKPVEQI